VHKAYIPLKISSYTEYQEFDRCEAWRREIPTCEHFWAAPYLERYGAGDGFTGGRCGHFGDNLERRRKFLDGGLFLCRDGFPSSQDQQSEKPDVQNAGPSLFVIFRAGRREQ
jgi:hypothetical protein